MMDQQMRMALAMLGRPMQGPPLLRPLQGNEQRPNADGSYSTEITMTSPDAAGQWENYPSLWMGPQGPVQFGTEDDAQAIANLYEQFGYRFPRYPTMDEAERAAIARSRSGGVGMGPLAATVRQR